MKSNDQRLEDIIRRLDSLSYVKPEKIPDIDLYMDQVTTFMDEQLRKAKRGAEDKVLTKTMINNYAKNHLLPHPVKKKYSRNHILLLIFIYYYKNILSITDIAQLLEPIVMNHFTHNTDPDLLQIYQEIFSMEEEEMDVLKKDVTHKFSKAQKVFSDAPEDSREYLQLFAFISELAFDVYLKKQMIEQMLDQLRGEAAHEKNIPQKSSAPKKKK